MNRLRGVILSVGMTFVLFPILSGYSYAGKENRNYLNGRPFSELSDRIEENRDSILDLETSTSQLREDLNALEADVGKLKTLVSQNTAGIVNLDKEISVIRQDLEGAIEKSVRIRSELEILKGEVLEQVRRIQDLDGAVAANICAILDLDDRVDVNLDRIRSLDSSLAEKVQEILLLKEEMASLQSRVHENMYAYFELLAEMNTYFQEETVLMQGLQEQIDHMSAQVQLQIQTLEEETTNLRARIEASEDLTVSELALANTNINYLLTQAMSLNNRIISNTNALNALQTKFEDHYHRYWDYNTMYYNTYYIDYSYFSYSEPPTY